MLLMAGLVFFLNKQERFVRFEALASVTEDTVLIFVSPCIFSVQY